MARIKQASLPVLFIVLIAGGIGYLLGCTQSEREKQSQATAAEEDTPAQPDASSDTAKATGTAAKKDASEKPKITPTGTLHDPNVYFPGTEELKPDEMRVIACGTGMPTAPGIAGGHLLARRAGER